MARAKQTRQLVGIVSSKKVGRSPGGASIGLDRNLEQILASLAQLLVASGYGFNRTMRMTKAAFVNAAKETEVAAGKKLSIARIAATTGLTRIEVSRMLRSRGRNPSVEALGQSRVARVAKGWASDHKYLDAKSRARPLPFGGKGSSFSALVKAYSGDIPARAMLSEMKRLGMVCEEKGGAIRLLRFEGRISRTTISAMRAISPWVNQLARFAKTARNNELTSSNNHVRLRFASMPQILAAIRMLEEREAAFLEALAQLGGHPVGNGKFDIEVSVAIAATKPSQIRLRTQPRR